MWVESWQRISMVGKALLILLLVVLPEAVFDGLVKQNESVPSAGRR